MKMGGGHGVGVGITILASESCSPVTTLSQLKHTAFSLEFK